MGHSRPLFVNFRYFLIIISINQIEKNLDGVLGIRTEGRRMVGADKTTELWRPHEIMFICVNNPALLGPKRLLHSKVLTYQTILTYFVRVTSCFT